MYLSEAKFKVMVSLKADPLYGAIDPPLIVGTLSKPTRLKDDPDYLLYVLIVGRNNCWFGRQIGLSDAATAEIIQDRINRYWIRWDSSIDRYERFYTWHIMSLDSFVAYNKQQHARPLKEKQIRDEWSASYVGLILD